MRIVITLLAVLLCGCASEGYQPGTMLPGRIVCLADGTTLAMQYELTSGSGKMIATNPVTGEVLQGNYTAVLETKVRTHQATSLFGSDDTSVDTTDVADGSAVLVGNKGTVINLKLHVKVGNPPTGYGDGEDNKGVKYNVQF
ncbi:MAG: hypothetical protein P4L57_15035 [Rhizomicrobium sp.]|nr:hypothetical protein [Rhizomicrobium sp.]